MGVPWVRGENLLLGIHLILIGICDEARRAGEIIQVGVVIRPAVQHDGPLLHDAQRGDDGGGVVGVGGVFWVVWQRVAPTQDEGHALPDGYRLEEFNHVGVGGAQDADIIYVDNDIT